jgi:hypothetical protein
VPLPHNLFGFVGMQADTEAGTAEAAALDQTISKYEQEKSGASAAYASPWVFTAHNNTPNAPRLVHFVFQARRRSIGRGLCSGPL